MCSEAAIVIYEIMMHVKKDAQQKEENFKKKMFFRSSQ